MADHQAGRHLRHRGGGLQRLGEQAGQLLGGWLQLHALQRRATPLHRCAQPTVPAPSPATRPLHAQDLATYWFLTHNFTVVEETQGEPTMIIPLIQRLLHTMACRAYGAPYNPQFKEYCRKQNSFKFR